MGMTFGSLISRLDFSMSCSPAQFIWMSRFRMWCVLFTCFVVPLREDLHHFYYVLAMYVSIRSVGGARCTIFLKSWYVVATDGKLIILHFRFSSMTSAQLWPNLRTLRGPHFTLLRVPLRVSSASVFTTTCGSLSHPATRTPASRDARIHHPHPSTRADISPRLPRTGTRCMLRVTWALNSVDVAINNTC